MKNYTITVNGNVYDVVVEEGASTGAPVAAKAPAAPKAAPKAPAAAPKASGAAGSIKVEAGAAGKIFKVEAGKILGIKAAAGTAVKRGQVILLLEAMKMEIPVVAPEDGTVASIDVAVGDTVEAGAVLATLN